jgi:hypothetical protein
MKLRHHVAAGIALAGCLSSTASCGPHPETTAQAPGDAATSDQTPGPGDALLDDGGCHPFAWAQYVPGTKPISFARDVVPIFAQSCSIASCHGLSDSPMGSLYLGPNINNTADQPDSIAPLYPPDAATLGQIYRGLVGKTATLAISMVLVNPAHPESSFLMHKIDGDQGCSGVACRPISTGVCGESMPQRSTPIPRVQGDTVRDWILHGAVGP